MSRIYLDHLSTTPLLPEARAAMEPFLRERYGTPSSRHREGIVARQAIAQARAEVAGLVNAPSPDGVIFTSGATESANLAVKGIAWANREHGDHIVLSGIEHPAVIRAVEFLEQQGFRATRVPVDSVGRIDPGGVREAMTDQTILVCIHHANHDLGTIQPVEPIHALAADRGISLFIDASTSAGWLPLDLSSLPSALVSLAPHRFYGPQGVGVLYRPSRARLVSLVHGGVQESNLRAGTENVAGIVGAGCAAAHASAELDQRREHVTRLQQLLWEGLRRDISSIQLNGPELGGERSPLNLNVSPDGVEGEGLALALDLRGVALHSGPACVSGSLKVSPVLAAIGLSAARALSSITVSPGKDTTPQEIVKATSLIATTVARLRALG